MSADQDGMHGSAPVVVVAGIPLASLGPVRAANHVAALAANGGPVDVHLVNAFTTSLVDSQPRLSSTILSATLNFADGKPLTWAARWVAGRPVEQVRGPDLFERVLQIGDRYGLRHFLLGGSEETLARLRQTIHTRFPNAQIVGTSSPPFRPLAANELLAQDELIRNTGANIVWVGLGTPKQDFEAARLASENQITAVAIGAAFGFTAGTLRRAPQWMSQFGLEWLFRLAVEPRRLWRRYTVGNVRFVWAVFRPRQRDSSV